MQILKKLTFVLFLCFLSFVFNNSMAQNDTILWNEIKNEFENSAEFVNSFHGIAIYDIDKKKYVFEINSHKYFTPASNTKIPTLYAGLKYLKDSLPAIRYLEKGDSLIIWGTGDPTFLNGSFYNYKVYDFLKNTNKKIYLSVSNYKDDHFGSGWAWDDFQSKYVPEKAPFPIYGNMVRFIIDKECSFKTSPQIFENYAFECDFPIINEENKRSRIKINRDLEGNLFNYYIANKKQQAFESMPFRASAQFITRLLSDTLKKEVQLISYPIPAKTNYLFSVSRNNMLRKMMQRSDNFLAEQTLLMVSDLLFESLETEQVINYIQTKHFRFANPPKWVDGSGLSRYNLFSPKNFIEILLKIWHEPKMEKKDILEIFAIGGKAGTLASRYKEHPTFLYAKTGTLSNNHSISGYLVTKSGKTLCFSFQNNHFLTPVGKIGDKMEEILTKIYLTY